MQSTEILCPVCGSPGRLVVRSRGRRRYYYVRHGRRGEHYVGPVGAYEHASTTHRRVYGMSILGPLEKDAIVNYLWWIADYIERLRDRDPALAASLASACRPAVRRLARLLNVEPCDGDDAGQLGSEP